MGDSLSAIADDEDLYDALCSFYVEIPRDCYGPHADLLKECKKTNKAPYEIRKARRERAREIEKNADNELVNRYFLYMEDVNYEDNWYIIDTAKRADWKNWLALVSEEIKQPSFPSFVKKIKNIDKLTFTDPK